MVSKLIGVVVALSVVLAVAGCGGQATTTSVDTGTSAPAATTSSPSTTSSTSSTSTTISTSSVVTQTATVFTKPSSTAAPTTATSTSTSDTQAGGCAGGDCQPSGTPTATGSVSPVHGKCPAGYFYLPPQDNGPALCIRQQGGTSTSASP